MSRDGGHRAGVDRPPGTTTQRVAAVFTLTVACCAAVLPLAATYAPGPVPALFCAAAVGGAAVTAGLRAARLAASIAILAALVVLCVAVVGLGTWLPLPAAEALPDAVLAAVRYSGARILTTSVPLPVPLETVVLPLCGTWLAAATGAALLTIRRPALAALPPVTLLAGAIALVGPADQPGYGYPVLLVAALVVLLALTRGGRFGPAHPDPVPARPGRPRAPVAAIAVFTVLATGATGAVLLATADRQPPDLRAHVDPPGPESARLGRGDPASRLLAAWAEVGHGLRLAGHRLGRSAAMDDVARLAVAATGDGLRSEVDALAGAVNALAFGERTPAAADTERLVAGVRAYRRALRRRTRRARRLTWWLDPRPPWWR
ncbi:hypothetical protein ABNF97_29030 [Plantactinospora sp. B6F1]|uniref:hypothetical protein n=1 Tax=Plantactinospora sp. B6F1 TaxID=3158971 RepID=UPI0032D8D9DE